jgi:hypothetical protein
LLDRLNPTIAELSQAVEQEVEKCPEAQRLATHPGVGPLTALAFVLIIGKAERFQCGKQEAVEAWAIELAQRYSRRPVAVALQQVRGALGQIGSMYVQSRVPISSPSNTARSSTYRLPHFIFSAG